MYNEQCYMLYFRLVLNMATQLQLNQTRKAYIINNMQTPSNCAINPFEIVEIWVSHYPGLPFTDDNGKFIWAYIMDDAMNWNNLHYEAIRNSRRKYLGFPIPQSDNIWKPEATVKVSRQFHLHAKCLISSSLSQQDLFKK